MNIRLTFIKWNSCKIQYHNFIVYNIELDIYIVSNIEIKTLNTHTSKHDIDSNKQIRLVDNVIQIVQRSLQGKRFCEQISI